MREIVDYLPSDALLEIAQTLDWNPVVYGERTPQFSDLTATEKRAWLARNRGELVNEIRLTAGHSLMNLWRRMRSQAPVSYNELLCDIAGRLTIQPNSDTDEYLEERIVSKLWNDTLSKLTPEQREELFQRARIEAGRQGVSVANWAGAAALGGGLAAANLAGFSLYIAASTILGAINGALGMGLGFGAFMGMSKLIAIAIGPTGWVFFIVSLFVGFGGPNFKKLIPIVVLITAYRHDLSVKLARAFQDPDSSAWINAIGDIPSESELKKNRLNYIERVARSGSNEWPNEKRWKVLANLATYLQGNDADSTALASWLSSELETKRWEIQNTTESLIKWISRVTPERLEPLLDSLLDANPKFVKLAYSYAPDGSNVHHRTVMTIAREVHQTLSDYERSFV